MKIDFSAVEEKDFTPAPAGRYLLRVTNATEGVTSEQSKNPGQPKVSVELTIDTEGSSNGKKIFETFTFAENMLWKLKNFMRALGYDVDSELDVEPDEWIGEEVFADVTVTPAQGNYSASNSVKRFHPVGGDSDLELDE